MIKTVLADDEKKVVYLLQKLIDWETLGYEIVGIAHDGIHALELVREKEAQLLLTDIRMPGCDGIELIRRAKELNPGLNVIIISGYREFEYAQQALKYGVEDYLLKPLKKDELTNILLRVQDKQEAKDRREYRQKKDDLKKQELMLTQLKRCAERNLDFPKKEQLNDEYGLQFADGICYAAIVKPDIPEGWKHIEGYRLVMQHSFEIVRRELGEISEAFAAAIFPEGIFAVISSPSYQGVDVKQCFTKIRREIEKQRDVFWNIRASVAIGSRKERTEDLPGSLREAAWLCRDRLCRQQVWRDADSEKPDFIHSYDLDGNIIRRLREAAEYLDEAMLVQALDESYTDLVQSEGLNGQMVEEWFRTAAGTCISGMYREQKNGQLLLDKMFELFWCCANLQDVYTLLQQILCRELKQRQEENAARESRPITEAKRYIQAHFQEELKLEDVSAVAGFNTTYFSTLFKKETGRNFSDYLTELRVNKAKELLCEEGLSIQDVCEMVGYRDLKYFSRLFKKVTGISPSDHRKMYR